MTSTAPLRCKCRKQALTSLRCSRCFVPICPDCSRPAAVGMLCSSCARGKPSHLYVVEPRNFALAIPVTLGAALFGGWLMATVRGMGFFGIFAGLVYGLVIGEVAVRMTGRKRGLPIEILAGICALLGLLGGYTFHLYVAGPMAGAYPWSPGFAGTDAPNPLLMLLLDPWVYVTFAVSVVGAVSRVRNI